MSFEVGYVLIAVSEVGYVLIAVSEVGYVLISVSKQQQLFECTDSYNCAGMENCFSLTAYICHFQPPSCL
jgi:hypothetical protein